MSSKMKKHAGIITSTGAKCIVVFRTIPGDPDNCLVVETDKLNSSYHDGIIDIVNSNEAQDTADLYTVLNRRTLFDGSNALQALHYKGYMRKVPVSLIMLKPMPNRDLPLSILNEQMGSAPAKHEPVASGEKVEEVQIDKKSVIAGLTLKADLLESEAKKIRADIKSIKAEIAAEEEAADAKVFIRTGEAGRPALTPEAKEQALVRKNEKHMEAYYAKKQAKVDEQLNEAVIQAAQAREANADNFHFTSEDNSLD